MARGSGACRTRSPAFAQSCALGATGVESDVALTADGVAVLIHPGILARLRRPVSALRRDQLRAHVPTLEELYRACGPDLDVALDMAAPDAVEQVVATARAHGDPSRLWLTYWRVDALARWRRRYPDVRLVFPALALRRAGSSVAVRCCGRPASTRSTSTTAPAARPASAWCTSRACCSSAGAPAVARGGADPAQRRRRRVLRRHGGHGRGGRRGEAAARATAQRSTMKLTFCRYSSRVRASMYDIELRRPAR